MDTSIGSCCLTDRADYGVAFIWFVVIQGIMSFPLSLGGESGFFQCTSTIQAKVWLQVFEKMSPVKMISILAVIVMIQDLLPHRLGLDGDQSSAGHTLKRDSLLGYLWHWRDPHGARMAGAVGHSGLSVLCRRWKR